MLTRSKCLDCPHQHMDKDKCLKFDDCLLRTEREPIYCATPAVSRAVKDDYECEFPGCDWRIRKGRYCKRHSMLVSVRKKRWGKDSEHLHDPVDGR